LNKLEKNSPIKDKQEIMYYYNSATPSVNEICIKESKSSGEIPTAEL
jgi:hypothetical protein